MRISNKNTSSRCNKETLGFAVSLILCLGFQLFSPTAAVMERSLEHTNAIYSSFVSTKTAENAALFSSNALRIPVGFQWYLNF